MRFTDIQLSGDGLHRTKLHEWVIRFAFGGVISLLAGYVGLKWGPAIGGLFLGFPSIFPATMTLLKNHQGRREAAEGGVGTSIGSLGLIVFAIIVFVTARTWSPVSSFGAAILGWFAASTIMWRKLAARNS